MREVEEHPNRLVYVTLVFAFIVYFFIAAVPLKKEFSLRPVWARDISAPESPSTVTREQSPLAYSLGGRYGFVSRDGDLLFSAKADFDVAVSDSVVIPYSRDSSELSALGPNGETLFRIQEEGWPFFRSGRLFLVSPEMNSITEYSLDGKRLWSYDFPVVLTEFDASASLSLAGLLDGTLECVDQQGNPLLTFSPGGSRIEVILGAALDPGEEALAAVCGVEKQRFVLLARKGDTFKVQHHTYLDSDYREPVSVRFIRDGRFVLYRQSEGIIVFDRSDGSETILPIRAQSFDVVSDPERGIEFIFAHTGRTWTVVGFQPPGQIIFRYTVPTGSFWARFSDQSLFLGSGTVLGRVDLSED